MNEFVEVVARCAAADEDTGVSRGGGGGDVTATARAFVESARAMRGGTAQWRLASAGGEVVGVILPTANDGGPVLQYLGVVPEQRGRGLVDDLLGETARLQAAAGAERVRADSDEDDTAMHAAFARAGWRAFGRRTTYRLELQPMG